MLKTNKTLEDKYKAGRLVVNCTTLKNAKEFLAYCSTIYNEKWCTGELIDVEKLTHWETYKSDTCYH